MAYSELSPAPEMWASRWLIANVSLLERCWRKSWTSSWFHICRGIVVHSLYAPRPAGEERPTLSTTDLMSTHTCAQGLGRLVTRNLGVKQTSFTQYFVRWGSGSVFLQSSHYLPTTNIRPRYGSPRTQAIFCFHREDPVQPSRFNPWLTRLFLAFSKLPR